MRLGKELTQEMGWRLNTAPATYEQLHKALLSGLLGNIGMKDVQADYKTPPYIGARAEPIFTKRFRR